MKILVIEDETDLQTAICKGLSKKGYAVDAASDGDGGLELAYINDYDLIVLDLNLPGMDGMDILKEIRRENKELKILILSARAEIEDRIAGLDMGANDYLIKPFHFDELEARIRALLRRTFVQRDATLSCGSLTLDTVARSAALDGQPLNLTKTELSILEYLLLHPACPISTETLMEHIYDSEADLFSNAVKVHIHFLRKKLGADLIVNVRGQGYLLSAPAGPPKAH